MATVNVARISSVLSSDAAQTIPDASGNDRHFRDFTAPKTDGFSPVILFFKFLIQRGPIRLRMRFASQTGGGVGVERDFAFNEGEEARSFHEIIPARFISERGNELIVSVTGQGRIVISDIFFLYHANLDVSGGANPIPDPNPRPNS